MESVAALERIDPALRACMTALVPEMEPRVPEPRAGPPEKGPAGRAC